MKTRAALLLVLALAACGRESAQQARSGDAAPPVAAAPAADDPPPVPEGDPRIALAAKMPGTRPADLRETPVPGIYELVHDGEISYVSADGKYVFSGNLFQVTEDGNFPNLTDLRKRGLRMKAMSELAEKDMVVFGPARAAHTITVFTDVDCQWCRRMHSQVEEYNALGIRVRYLAYPRSGPDTLSWHKAEAVWCAKDRQQALTAAKLGGEVAGGRCATPIAQQYAMGQRVGITGTPGVIFETGEMVPGYLPPQRMLEAIELSIEETPRADR